MISRFRFLEPQLLWLSVISALFLVLWFISYVRRRRDVRQRKRQYIVPHKERFRLCGRLLGFSLGLLVIQPFLIGALAKPQIKSGVRAGGGVSAMVVNDGSPSVRIEDSGQWPCSSRPDDRMRNRWQWEMCFTRAFTKELRWEQDRMGIALFADRGAPLVHLTQDPNVVLFFIEQIADSIPFRLDNVTSWNTNIEEGLFWSRRMIELFDDFNEERGTEDENVRIVVLVSDGGVVEGEVGKEIEHLQERGIPIYVVGVGTDEGGIIPGSKEFFGEPVHWSIERESLQAIARAGSGRYYELGKLSDREIARAILTDVASRRVQLQREQQKTGRKVASEDIEEWQDIYWYFLLFAAGPLAFALWSLR